MKTPNLAAYLERIGYQKSVAPDEPTLAGLHKAHTLVIPFENLDVFYQQPISLETAALFDKLVTQGRGGYCFEMNGLFSAVLKEIGFKVTPLLARVSVAYTRSFGPKTHEVLMVEVAGTRWLADVGFGKDGPVAPLLLDCRNAQHQFGRTYRLEPDEEFGYILDLLIGDRALCQYAFTLEKCYPADFILANHFTATHPASRFVAGRICTKPTEEGRISLTDQQLKIVSDGETSDTPVVSDTEFEIYLTRYFGLDLGKIQATGTVCS